MGISLIKRSATEEREKTAVRVAFYMRVSTAEQELEGYSPEFQKTQLLEHVKRKEYKGWVTRPEWHFFDVGSGSETEGRRQLQRLLECVRRGEVDIVLVWKIDRLSRNLSDLLRMFDEFSRHRVGFASTKEDLDFTGPIGRLIYQVFGALAEFERETIKMRTEEGRRASALAGNYTGSVAPYGFESVPNPGGKGRKLKVVPAEAEVVRRVFHWFIYDRWTFVQIAAELNRLGVAKGRANRTVGGTRWIDNTVRVMLASEEYRGVFITNRFRLVQKKPRKHEERPREEWIVVHMPPIIDDVLFYMAQERLRQVAEKHGGGGGQEQYMLRGKLVDVGTGRGFVGYRSTKNTKNYRRKQYISAGIHYRSIGIAATPLEEFVWSHVESAIRDPEEFLRIHQKGIQQGREKEALVEQLRLCEDQLSDQNRRIEKVNEDYYAERITDAERGEWLDRYRDKRDAAFQAKQEAEKNLVALGMYKTACDDLREFSRRLQGKAARTTYAEKQALVDLLVDRVEITDDEEGRLAKVFLRFDPKEIAVAIDGVEPVSSIHKGKTPAKGPVAVVDGGTEDQGYYLFAFETPVGYLGNNQHRSSSVGHAFAPMIVRERKARRRTLAGAAILRRPVLPEGIKEAELQQ